MIQNTKSKDTHVITSGFGTSLGRVDVSGYGITRILSGRKHFRLEHLHSWNDMKFLKLQDTV